MPHTDWFTNWHGEKISTVICDFNPGSGGSTTASTGVTLALSTKASLGHTHLQSEITGLESSLSGLAAQFSTKAAGAHTHAQADVTNLESTLVALSAQLSTKAAGSHTHTEADWSLSDITTANVNASAHGLCPKLPANSTTFFRSDGGWASPPGGAGGGPTLVKSTVSSTINSTFSNVTGLSFSVSSASAYYFEYFLNWNVTVATNGAKFAVSGPASPTFINYQIDISTGASGSLVRSAQAYDTCVAITAAASTGKWPAWIGGTLVTGANAGTLIARAAPRVTSTTVIVSSGSVGMLFGPF